MLSSKANTPRENAGRIVKQGNLKKLKTMKKKYFVLRGDSAESSCLEYYENEKKFKNNYPPRRVIKLKNCFNINRRSDKKQKFVIGLYSRVGCFCIVFDREEELDEWLDSLLRLQHGESLQEGEDVKPFFEHVWKVEVMERDMGCRMGILGSYHVCLTNQAISLIKATTDDNDSTTINFSLEKVRACGHMNTFFYMEVGNDTVTGAGNLWMTTGDATIAESMHNTIKKACARCHKDPLPTSRNRSGSANESSKPASIMQRWPTHTGDYVSSPRNVTSLRPSERRHSVAAGSGNTGWNSVAISHQRTYSFPLSPACSTQSEEVPQANNCLSQVRDKYESLPSRSRTTSEGNHLPYSRSRPHSIYNKANSPPVHILSPVSGACSTTDSAGSSMSVDGGEDWDESSSAPRFHSLTPDEPVIVEENTDEYPPWPQEDEKLNNYMQMGSSTSITNTTYRKISPNPFAPQSSIKSSSPSQGSLADVYSPVSSSPLDATGYMPMSPVDVRLAPFTGTSCHNHSRGSSIDDIGYVATMPSHHSTAHSDDGYVDMDQKSARERHQSCGNTSGGSSCSLTTSGTPSGDLTKLSEYSLSSGIGPEELRPARAYSFGSRPHNNNNKSDIMGCMEEKRGRALSVGSHQQCRIVPSISRIVGLKPASSPATTLTVQSLSQSHPSMEYADDLMEMDFSNKGKHIKNIRAIKKPSSAEKLSDTGLSPPKTNRLAALFGRSPPKVPVSPPQGHPSPSLDRVPEAEPGYVEMTPGGQSPDTYVDMKPVMAPVKHCLKPQSFPKFTSHQPPIKPALFAKPSPERFVDMSLKRKTSLVEDNNNSKIVISQNQVQNNDGYVDMQFKTSSMHFSSLPQKEESNYMNMMGSNKTEKRHHRKDRRFSQPIKIQAKELTRKTTPLVLPIGGSSPLRTNGSVDSKSGSIDSNRSYESSISVDSNKLDTGPNEYKNGCIDSKVFVTMKSPCNACDYVMFQAPVAVSNIDPMSDYTMMGPPGHSSGSDKSETVDVLRTGLGGMSLSDTENMSRHSEDEPTTDSSKSLSRASSTTSVGEKDVEYAALDLRTDDRLSTPQPQPHSYARIDFANFESNKLKN